MYEPPMVYTEGREVDGDALKAMGTTLLTECYNVALKGVVSAANAKGDYLDPNSITVKVIVEARAL